MSTAFVFLDDQGRVLPTSACPDERGADRPARAARSAAGGEAEGVLERQIVTEHVG